MYCWLETLWKDPVTLETLLNQVCERLISAMKGAGIQLERQNREPLHDWLLRWFNADPQWVNRDELYKNARYRDDEQNALPLMNDSLVNVSPE